MGNARTPGPLRDFDDVANPRGPVGCAEMGLSCRAWNTPGPIGLSYHRPVRVADAPKTGKVVRIERKRKEDKFKRKPPGPGAYTQEELRNWYEAHPNAKTKSVNKVNGKRTQGKAYTPEELWWKGYFYAITNVFGNSGTEVWLKDPDRDDLDGKVIGIDREIP
jgi:hypothetical protein